MNLINLFLRRLFTGTFTIRECHHIDQVQKVTPQSDVCAKCVELGDTWPDLRVCMTCGHVGCCDKAKNQHAFKHYQETGHPIMRPFDDNIFHRWMWCYPDNALLDLPADLTH